MLVMIKLMIKLKLFLTLLNIKRFDATLKILHFKIRKHVDNVYHIVVIELNSLSKNLQLATKIVRTAPLTQLFHVDCKFCCSFLISTARHGVSRLYVTFSQKERKFWVSFKKVKGENFCENITSYFCHLL